MLPRQFTRHCLWPRSTVSIYRRTLAQATLKTRDENITATSLPTSAPAAPTSVSESTTEVKSFLAPPPYQPSTPQWILNSPTLVNLGKGLARLLGYNSKATTAIRETRSVYEMCAEREVKEAGFIYVGEYQTIAAGS